MRGGSLATPLGVFGAPKRAVNYSACQTVRCASRLLPLPWPSDPGRRYSSTEKFLCLLAPDNEGVANAGRVVI